MNSTVPNDLFPRPLNPLQAPRRFLCATTEWANTTGISPQYKNTSLTSANSSARNPIGELAQVISQCYDAKTGKVKIPGFYDDVVAPTKDELNSFVNSGFTTKGYMKAHELKSIRTNLKTEADVLKAFMAAPTFEVHGITGGYGGPGVKTIVPYRSEAKISTRLVPGQRPAKIAKLIKD